MPSPDTIEQAQVIDRGQVWQIGWNPGTDKGMIRRTYQATF